MALAREDLLIQSQTSVARLLLLLVLPASSGLIQPKPLEKGHVFDSVEDVEAALIADLVTPGGPVVLMFDDTDSRVDADVRKVAATIGPLARVSPRRACTACTERVNDGDVPAGGTLALFQPRKVSDSTVGVSVWLSYGAAGSSVHSSRQIGALLVRRAGHWVVAEMGGRIITSRRSPRPS